MNYRDNTRIGNGTLCRHNIPVEESILNTLKFKVGDKIKAINSDPIFTVVAISYDYFKGSNKNYIRYEFDNYQFIWVQNEKDYEIK